MRSALYIVVPALALLPQTPTLSAAFTSGTVEALGACEVRPESVACWDMEGKPAPTVTDSVRSYLSSNGEVQFRLGKKNRYVVTRRPQRFSVNYRLGENGVYGNSTYNSDPVFDFIRVAVDPTETRATLNVTAVIQSPKDVDIPFREGAKAEVEGKTVEIGPSAKASKEDRGDRGRPLVGEGWSIPMSIGGDTNGGGWNYVPLDDGSQPIRYVDDKGRPITALKALSLEPTLQSNGFNNYVNPNARPSDVPKKAANAFFQAGYSGTFRATTNIDPKSIAKLRIRASHSETKELGPFPLDPR